MSFTLTRPKTRFIHFGTPSGGCLWTEAALQRSQLHLGLTNNQLLRSCKPFAGGLRKCKVKWSQKFGRAFPPRAETRLLSKLSFWEMANWFVNSIKTSGGPHLLTYPAPPPLDASLPFRRSTLTGTCLTLRWICTETERGKRWSTQWRWQTGIPTKFIFNSTLQSHWWSLRASSRIKFTSK